jgi:hypothetical protein
MKTLTVKVPEKLDLQLTAAAAKRGESKSNLIREAIESILNANEKIAPTSCLDMAKDLVGSIEGPSDLSCDKKHFKGYGK